MTGPSPDITEADLVAYVDERLDAERAALVEAWLAEHPADRERIARWRPQTGLLRAALDPVAAEPVPERLVSALSPRPARRWPWSAAAAIAGVAIGIGGGFLLWGGKDAPPGSDIAAIGISAYEVYSAEVRHPVEVTVEDAGHLVAWLSSRLGVDVIPPDLSADGLVLLGGRLVPQDGRPAAMLMYEDASGERYALLMARYDDGATTSFRYAETEEICAYYWMVGNVGYVLAGPQDRQRLWQLSRAVYDQMM